jgi:hypothetical protein
MEISTLVFAVGRLATQDVFTKVLEAWLKRGVRNQTLSIKLQKADGTVQLTGDELNPEALELLVKGVLSGNHATQVEARQPAVAER